MNRLRALLAALVVLLLPALVVGCSWLAAHPEVYRTAEDVTAAGDLVCFATTEGKDRKVCTDAAALARVVTTCAASVASAAAPLLEPPPTVPAPPPPPPASSAAPADAPAEGSPAP